MIKVEHINKSFDTLKVLTDINMQVERGEVVSIVGASGAGKTTLLQIIGTLDRPDSGKVFINGCDILALKAKELSLFRNKHIGFVFQFHNLLPEFTALENVCLPALIGGQNINEAKKRALELLSLLKVEHREAHKPAELSGGEQQRVAVARALMNNPDVVLADEPSGNLDSTRASELHNLFFELRAQLNQTFVIVTHNDELARMADRVITMKDGTIQEV